MGGIRSLILALVLGLGCSPLNGDYLKTTTEQTVEYISSVTSSVIESSRRSTVKVVAHNLEGNQVEGSGAYFKFHGHHLILTAAHVVEGNYTALIVAGGERVIADVVYFDEASDIAVLRVEGLFTRKPLAWRLSNATVGDEVLYTGFPNSYDALVIQGNISGFIGRNIVMHSYGWYGSSGSVVLDRRGRIVGIVSAVDIGYGFFGMPQIVEDIVIVVPIRSLNERELLDSLSKL